MDGQIVAIVYEAQLQEKNQLACTFQRVRSRRLRTGCGKAGADNVEPDTDRQEQEGERNRGPGSGQSGGWDREAARRGEQAKTPET